MTISDFNIFFRTEHVLRTESFFPSRNHFIDPFTHWPGQGPGTRTLQWLILILGKCYFHFDIFWHFHP